MPRLLEAAILHCPQHCGIKYHPITNIMAAGPWIEGDMLAPSLRCICWASWSTLLPVFKSSDFECKSHGSRRALGGSSDDFTGSVVIYSFSVPHTIFLTDAKSDVG